MYWTENRLVLSAGDLVGHLLCPHLTSLSLQAADGEVPLPERNDPELEVLSRRGLDHERAYLDELERAGLSVVRIDQDTTSLDALRDAASRTMAAMRDGADIVFQAALIDETTHGVVWQGRADFLRRVDQASDLGTYAYEPEDTKLARHTNPSAVLQLCHYAEHVERLQGVAPERVHIVLGNGTRESFLLRELVAYYHAAKTRFTKWALAESQPETYPLPVSHCAVCRWSEVCDQKRLADDHLCLLPDLTREQARKFEERAGISTVTALAASPSGLGLGAGAGDSEVGAREPGGVGVGHATVERHRRQARLQVKHRNAPPGTPPPWELLEAPGENQGLGSLPEPDPGDVFFDIEGDPFVGDGGLEYLFGVGWLEGGRFVYRAFWAHTPAEEQRAFEELIDWLLERRAEHPGMHVYHYAAYEPVALGRLTGRYATREEEFDQLLRSRTFVDLYRVVRQALAIGVDSYSLKKLEPLYMAVRTDQIIDAGSSISYYENWLATGDDATLYEIEKYNLTDCESTWRLRDWLEDRRTDAVLYYGELPSRPPVTEESASEDVAAHSAEIVELVGRLTAGLDEAPDTSSSEETQGRWLLAQLLDWHRREAKPEWWRFFHRVLNATEDDLFNDTEAIAGLRYEGVVEHIMKSSVHRYRFNPDQEHKLQLGTGPRDPESERRALLHGEKTPAPGTLVAVNPIEGTLDLKRGINSKAPHPTALIPPGPIDTGPMQGALLRFGRWVADNDADADGDYRAARDLLLRRPPRVTSATGMPGADGPVPVDRLVLDGEEMLDAAIRLATLLDGGCLPIQGPPGSGKTYISARVVVALVAGGKRVGISAHSHAVISNLLAEVVDCARERGVPVRAVQKVSEDDGDHVDEDVQRVTNNKEVLAALVDGEANVVAGTSWLFSREDLHGQLDHLIVDEAGQLSLANVCAISGAARNLVLVGDPQQLAQPSKGAHPPGAQVSALEHILGGHDTIPLDRGLFVGNTRRLHPEICAFVSETSYDGQLRPIAGLERQQIGDGPVLSGSGLRWHPVEHEGNRTSSLEEVQAVDAMYCALLGRPWTNADGSTQPLTSADILVVAPYNAQVRLLCSMLPADARVGTVDRFQGQEAAVVLMSLAASTAEDVPRGMEFLYSRNRLNVGVSRARALCVLVASPTLVEARVRSVHQLRLANGLCRFIELAN